LAGIGKVRMLVDIKYTPDFVVLQKTVSLPAGFPLGLLFHFNGTLDESFRYSSSVIDNYFDKSGPLPLFKFPDIGRFGNLSLAQHKHPRRCGVRRCTPLE
jgi:hypothetical protein